eukprot:130527_1
MGNCASKTQTDHSYNGLLNPNTIIIPNHNNAANNGLTTNGSNSNLHLSGSTSLQQKQDIVVLLTKPERKVLIHGFVGKDMAAPDDVIELIASAFMDESFYWSIKHDQLYKLRHDMDHVISFTSSIFIYHSIHFQLQLTKIFKENSDHGFQLSARLLSKNVVITTTIALQCVDTQCGYHNFVDNFFESGWPSSTLKLSDIDDDMTELNFICTFDILRIEPIHVDTHADSIVTINPFYKQVHMQQRVDLMWRLRDEMKASYRTDNDDSSLILFYESPQFEDGSYVVHFIQSNVMQRDGFAVMLELFTYPRGVSKLTLKWIVMVMYDGKIIKKSSTDSFSLNESCHSKAFSKSDFHFIGESNVFSLSLLSIKVEIEILEIYDEYNQMIESDEVRHWPQYGVFNEGNNKKINELKLWLSNIGLLSYFELLFDEGFDSLDMMKEITDVQQLGYVGINPKAHQIKLMNQINKLKAN